MFKIDDYVVYKRNVCKIKQIKDDINYVLVPIDDESLVITVPKSNLGLRNIVSKEESLKLIKSIPSIDIIKTTYLRNEDRLANNKKIGEKDDNYFKKAEKLLYNELSISLGLSYNDTQKYIKETVENLIK